MYTISVLQCTNKFLFCNRATVCVIAMAGNNRDALEFNEMRERLQEIEDEAVNRQDPAAGAANPINREDVDSRSVFVGNVSVFCPTEYVQNHFAHCGTVNSVTLKTNQHGHPMGCAFVEFLNAESVRNAILLNGSKLLGRELKVEAKRPSVPDMNQYWPRRGSGSRTPSMGAPSRGYGKSQRNRPPGRYRPY